MSAAVARFAATSFGLASIGPVDIALQAGQCLGISGPSGAGKTLLLRAMADLDTHCGECRLDGRAATEMSAPAWRSQVMYLAAEPRWWADTPNEHFSAATPQLGDWLTVLQLDSALLFRPMERISSGQRQRLALLRMLCREPQVLLLDEPTANLDNDNSRRVERLIDDYRRQRGACVIWVSHDDEQLARVADCRLVLAATGQVGACN